MPQDKNENHVYEDGQLTYYELPGYRELTRGTTVDGQLVDGHKNK
jgi:hypothetical protein